MFIKIDATNLHLWQQENQRFKNARNGASLNIEFSKYNEEILRDSLGIYMAYNHLLSQKKEKITADEILKIHQEQQAGKKAKRKRSKGISQAKELNKYHTENEMLVIENKDFGELQRYADMYILLQRLGINHTHYMIISDWKSKFQMYEGRYFFHDFRSKNEGEILALVHPKVLQVLEKYNYHPPRYSRQCLNKRLKEIASILKMDSFSVKYARKTFTNHLFDNGATVETCAKGLGHTGLEMVLKHYTQVRHKKILRELSNVIK
jgi:integrase